MSHDKTILLLDNIQEQELLSHFERLAAITAAHNKAYSEAEIAADIAAALAEVRANAARLLDEDSD